MCLIYYILIKIKTKQVVEHLDNGHIKIFINGKGFPENVIKGGASKL